MRQGYLFAGTNQYYQPNRFGPLLRRPARNSRDKDEGDSVEEDGRGDEPGVALAEDLEDELGGDGGEGRIGEPDEFDKMPSLPAYEARSKDEFMLPAQRRLRSNRTSPQAMGEAALPVRRE